MKIESRWEAEGQTP